MVQYFGCPSRQLRFVVSSSAVIRKKMAGISAKMAFSTIATRGDRTGDILSNFVIEELNYLKEASPNMTEAERIAVQQEIDNMLQREYNGNSFEHLYIHEKLNNLAEKHWAAGHKNAALLLFELSLNYMKDTPQSVYGTLSRMAMLKKLDLTEQSSNADIYDNLSAAKDYFLRFPSYFSDSESDFLRFCYSLPAAWFFNYFPKLLSYDNYNEQFFNSALELARKNILVMKNDAKAENLLEKIVAWELINITVNVRDDSGNARNGTLKIKNISGSFGRAYLYPNEEVIPEERIFSVVNGKAIVPVYAGHLYDMSVSFPVTGGNSLVYSIPTFAHEKGKTYQYNTLTSPSAAPSKNGATEINFTLAQQPMFPYNLTFERSIDVFTLAWDWSAPFKCVRRDLGFRCLLLSTYD